MFRTAAPARTGAGMTSRDVLFELRDLRKYFPVKRGILFDRTVAQIKAVDGISFSIRSGETFGLVGESGCGKSTIGRLLLKLEQPTSGQILYEDAEIATVDARRTQAFLRLDQDVVE